MVTEYLTHSYLLTVYKGIVAMPADVCPISSSTLVSAFVLSNTNSLPLLSGCPLYLLGSTLQTVQNSAAKLTFIITPVLLNTLTCWMQNTMEN